MSSNLVLKCPSLQSGITIEITGSKSESNRALILQALYSDITLSNVSNSDDTSVLEKALSSDEERIDVHHAGTAMRFLTAYCAASPGKSFELTGSSRMKERPIGILVDALISLGAEISFKENSGFPPLYINGKAITKSSVNLQAGVSSQYISALLLIAPTLKNGLTINLLGEVTSRPYIEMTLSLLRKIGVSASFSDNTISVDHLEKMTKAQHLIIESDWSSASYFYSIIALAPIGTEVHFKYYNEDSLQGDSVLKTIYKDFGVETQFHADGIRLKKVTNDLNDKISIDLVNAPDIAQTIAVTCFGLGISCRLTGLHTLKIKETDRLEALQTELTKLGATISVDDHSLSLESSSEFKPNQTIETYQDHRMAMAFSPLAMIGSIQIAEADVVSKSYPNFWNDLKQLGIEIK